MDFNLDISTTRGLGNLEPHDIIEFESGQIERDTFMIVSHETDESIPAIIFQIWKFEGGYNHSFKNVMETDLGINTQVPFYEPEISTGKILKIIEYRPAESGLTPKEELFFDVWPDKTESEPTDECPIPFKALVQGGQEEQELIIPSWTPLQKLPLDRITKESVVELWSVKGVTNLMRVLRV